MKRHSIPMIWGGRGGSVLLAALVSFFLYPGCPLEEPGLDPQGGELRFPAALAVHPSGRYLYVVNSNFDLTYKESEGGTLVVVDAVTNEIISGQTIKFGSYVSSIVLNAEGTRAYLTVRGNNTLIMVDVDGANISCSSSPPEAGELPSCDEEHTIRSGSTSGVSFPAEPFGVLVDEDVDGDGFALGLDCADRNSRIFPGAPDGPLEGCDEVDNDCDGTPDWGCPCEGDSRACVSGDGCFEGIQRCVEGAWGPCLDQQLVECLPAHERVLVTHLAGSAISLIDVDPMGNFGLLDSLAIARGANSVAKDPLSGKYYVTSRYEGVVSLVEVIGGELFLSDTLTLSITGGSPDSRGVVFAPAGDEAYIVHRVPDSVVFLDTSLNRLGLGESLVKNVVDVGNQPSVIRLVQREEQSNLLYVNSLGENQIYVLDASLGQVVDIVEVGLGPYDLALSPGPNPDRLYVVNFEDNTVSVVDIDPKSPTFHEEIARLGNPLLF